MANCGISSQATIAVYQGRVRGNCEILMGLGVEVAPASIKAAIACQLMEMVIFLCGLKGVYGHRGQNLLEESLGTLNLRLELRFVF